MRITERETCSKSRWSLRLALFTAQLIIVTILLHRFTPLSTPVATNLIVVSLICAAIAFLLAILAFAQIWNEGQKGTGIALSGALVSLSIFAVPLYYLPSLVTLPAINDITTDFFSPPRFHQIAALRDVDANSITYPGASFISAQAKAYPDISTLLLERSNSDSFELIHGVVRDLGWKIVSEQRPDTKHETGYIEAVDQSRLLGFRDDIVVRVKGDNRYTRIDMRSASRYGRHDMGTNANRIRELFGVVKTRIAKAETKRIDNIERHRLALLALAKKKKKDRERLRRKKEEEANSQPVMLPKANFDQVGAFPFGTPEGLSTDPNQKQQTIGSNSQANRPSHFRPPTQARKKRLRKLRRSKSRRRRKKWVPFNKWP